MRCDMDLANPAEPCRRCKKAGRQCIVTQPSRRRQKKSDTRVAELERKIDALTAVIAQQNGAYPSQPSADQYPQPGDHTATPQSLAHHDSRPPMSASTPVQHYQMPTDRFPVEPDSQRSNKRRRVESSSDSQNHGAEFIKTSEEKHVQGGQALRHEWSIVFPSKIRTSIRDMVDPELMQRIFDNFVNNLTPTLPVVPLTPGATAEDVLENKPILMLAILSVGCTFIVNSDLRQALHDEIQRTIAEAVVQKGMKSLELIQALQVLCLWQKPPEKPQPPNFYVLIHIAAVMALDLGLGKKFNPARAKRGFGGPGSDLPPGPPPHLPPVDSDCLESRRAWIVSYFLCASAAQVLRRPNLLRWTNYMSQCVQLLENSPEAVPSDRMLAQHIKVQHICEEINTSFALDDPEATSISITDPKVAYTLNILESQLRDWEAQIPSDLRKPELMFIAHTTSLYLHEIALHVNHNTDDFRLPFTEASLKSGSEHGFAATLTQNQMTSIEACLKASHDAVDTFCSFDLDTHIVLPPLLYFVRIVYALIVLIKLHVAVMSPGSELGKIIKPDDIRVEEYINKLWDLFQEMATQHRMGPHHKAQHILGVLRDWLGTHQHGDSSTTKPANGKDPGAMSAPNQLNSRSSHDHHHQQHQNQHQQAAGNNSNDNLRVLSEAATAGANSQQQTSSTNWNYDSPSSLPYPPYNHMRSNSASNAHDAATSAGSSTVMSTPQAYPASSSDNWFSNNTFQQSQQQQRFGKQDNSGMDWTAGMDFEQAVNVALQDLDFSGDLFG